MKHSKGILFNNYLLYKVVAALTFPQDNNTTQSYSHSNRTAANGCVWSTFPCTLRDLDHFITCSERKTEVLCRLKPPNQDLLRKGHRNLCGLDWLPGCQLLRPGFFEMQLQNWMLSLHIWSLISQNYQLWKVSITASQSSNQAGSTQRNIWR